MKRTHSSSYFARLFIALAAVLLTACQSDDGCGKDDGEIMSHGTTVELSFRMNVSAGTRNANDNYFQNEHTISHLELFFFDAQTKKLVNRAAFDNLTQDNDPYNVYYDNSYIIQSISMNVGVYNIFAVANYNNIPEQITDQDEFLDLTDSVTYQSGIEANVPYQGPVMTSRATALLSIDLIPWAGKRYYLTIEMERVLAKLQIGISQNKFEVRHGDRKYADINITNYKLVNLSRQYYLFQHKDYMTELGEKPVFTLPDHFGDYSEEGDQYVTDPLFYQKTANLTDATQFGHYYSSWFGNFSTEDFASVPTAGYYGYAYILENTSFKTLQKNGYSPGIVFKAGVNPVFVYLYDTKTRTLVEENRAEYWPNTIYLYDYNFYGSIQAVNVASGLSLDELENYTSTQLKNYGIKKCNFNMGVYETYYTYWIRHRVNTPDAMGAMSYGVLRNNFYKIVVAGVSGVGDSEITPEILRNNYPNSYDTVLE